MAVQLIIDGNTVTDVLAQVQDLARATGEPSTGNGQAGVTNTPPASTASAKSTQAPAKSESTEAPAAGGKTLSRDEQDAAVKEMIEQGFKDPRFDQLTKGRQKEVEKGITEKDAAEEAGETTGDDDLDSMFEDGAEEEVEVTAQTVRDLMGKLGKDADGKQNQDNLLKIRDILVKHIPKGEEVKVGNIPEGKLAAVYADMKKLEA